MFANNFIGVFIHVKKEKTPENTPPRIYCPSIPSNWVVHKGAVTRTISWNEPTVYDNEDSYPR